MTYFIQVLFNLQNFLFFYSNMNHHCSPIPFLNKAKVEFGVLSFVAIFLMLLIALILWQLNCKLCFFVRQSCILTNNVSIQRQNVYAVE